MGTLRKLFLAILLVGTVTVILVTWGSIGSAVLTLALLLSLGYIVIHHIMENRDPGDFDWEG